MTLNGQFCNLVVNMFVAVKFPFENSWIDEAVNILLYRREKQLIKTATNGIRGKDSFSIRRDREANCLEELK